MNVKKTIKSIAAVAFGAAMIGSTVLGAADLASYPSNVMSNGAFNGKIVIGLAAKPQDVISAIDIATSLQAASVSETSVACDGAVSASYSVVGGKQIKTSTLELNYGEDLSLGGSLGNIDVEDMDDLLADGIVSDDDGTDYDYTQKIAFTTAATVEFGRPNDDVFGDDPVPYVDMTSSSAVYTLTVDFTDKLNATELEDSETITMFGKEFTFASDNGLADDLTLFSASSTETLSVGESKQLTIDGELTTFEVLGGNTDQGTALLKIDGTSKQVSEGTSYTVGGKSFRVKNVFTTTVPTDSVAVELMVGSDELVIPAGAHAGAEEVTLNDETVDGITAQFVGSDGTNGEIDKIVFSVTPSALSEDEAKYLLEGQEFVTPVFDTVKLSFKGVSPALEDESKEVVKFEQSGKTLTMTFTNAKGDDYTLDVFEFDSASTDNITVAEDLKFGVGAALNAIEDEDYFFLTDADGETTVLYQLKDVTTDSTTGINTTKILNVASGSTFEISSDDMATENIADSSVKIDAMNNTGNKISLSANAASQLFTQTGRLTLTSPAVGADASSAVVTFLEDAQNDIIEEASIGARTLTFTFSENEADENIETSAVASDGVSGTDFIQVFDDAQDFEYTVTELGTYVVRDDEDSKSVVAYVAGAEMQYAVFLVGEGATVSSSGSAAAGAVKTTKVNPIAVGVAISDEDAMSLVGKENLIVVGGPSVNTVSAKLKGNPSREQILAEYKPGVGLVELFDSSRVAELGTKVALLVSGYEYQDTQRAARAVASKDSRLKGNAVEVLGTSTTISDIKAVSKTE